MTTIIAIDPGRTGGIAWNSLSEGVQACCMPYDEDGVIKLLRQIIEVNANHRIIAYMELVTGYIKVDKDEEERENRQPAHQMFKFGRGVGTLVGALKMVGIEPREVSPRTWQKPFYVSLSKQNGQRKSRSERKRILRDIAQRRFQQIEVTLKTADALLIYAYASMMESQELEGIQGDNRVVLPIPFTNSHAERFSELKHAVANVLVNGKKDLSGGGNRPCKHGSGATEDGLNRAIVQPNNATPPAQNSFYLIDWKGSPYVVAPDQDGAFRMIRKASTIDVANLAKLPAEFAAKS